MHKLTFITCANNSMIKFRRREGRMSGGRGKGRKSGTKGRPFIEEKHFCVIEIKEYLKEVYLTTNIKYMI